MTTAFTPLSAMLGGALIGLAAVLLMAMAGRIAGISGIVARLLPPYRDRAHGERLAFVLGLIAAPLLFWLLAGSRPVQAVPADAALMIAAGLLVGFGAVYGNGCTSGHGVCGLARFSMRSLVATLTFMIAGFVTVLVTRHLLGG